MQLASPMESALLVMHAQTHQSHTPDDACTKMSYCCPSPCIVLHAQKNDRLNLLWNQAINATHSEQCRADEWQTTVSVDGPSMGLALAAQARRHD